MTGVVTRRDDMWAVTVTLKISPCVIGTGKEVCSWKNHEMARATGNPRQPVDVNEKNRSYFTRLQSPGTPHFYRVTVFFDDYGTSLVMRLH